MKKGGCWIFLSHSSHDIEKVRMIRNEFERYSHNPLAFHLKCLNADTPEGKRELDGLIMREIDSREWFVFCESPEAAASDYVQMEKDYIINNGKQNVWSIDMSLPVKELLLKVREICSLIKVYISFSARDGREIRDLLAEKLTEKDFDVRDSESEVSADSIMAQVEDNVRKTAENGFAVVLVTEAYSDSTFCLRELETIVSANTRVIPLVFGDAQIPEALRAYRCFRIPTVPSEEDVSLIIELIETVLESRIVGPIRFQADKYDKLCEISERLNYKKHYHPAEAVRIKTLGATDDYVEIYEFPCCGTRVTVGDGPVSRYRADGCRCDGEQ